MPCAGDMRMRTPALFKASKCITFMGRTRQSSRTRTRTRTAHVVPRGARVVTPPRRVEAVSSHTHTGSTSFSPARRSTNCTHTAQHEARVHTVAHAQSWTPTPPPESAPTALRTHPSENHASSHSHSRTIVSPHILPPNVGFHSYSRAREACCTRGLRTQARTPSERRMPTSAAG